MIGNLLDLTPNKVSVDLTQYSTVLMGDTGVGKTMSTFCTLCDYLGIYDEDSIYGNVNKES